MARAITVGALVAVALGAVAQASRPVDTSTHADPVGPAPAAATPGTDATVAVPQDPRRRPAARAVTPPAVHVPAAARRPAPVSKGTGAADQDRRAPSRRAAPAEVVAEPAVEPAAPPTRILMWPRVPGAVAYRVELYRESSRILARVTRPPKIALAASWGYQGLRRELSPGRYEWIVYALRRSGSELVQAEAVIRSQWLLAP